MSKLTERYSFRLTPEERERLDKNADMLQASGGDYIRQLINGTDIYVVPVADKIVSTLAVVYNALNIGDETSIKNALERMDELCDILRSVKTL